MFRHLDQVSAKHPDGIPSDVINSFTFEGALMRLIVQPGIRKPALLSAALTIRTTYTPPGADAPYEMHGSVIFLPRSRRDHPDRSRLEERYEQFRSAA